MKQLFMKAIAYGCVISPSFTMLVYCQLNVENNERKPNIIIFLSDDHGAEDMGCMGNIDTSTPVMDALASEGILFTRAFASAAVCAPSRSSIFTGLYPHRHGCHPNHSRINEGIKTLPGYLKEQGYRVTLANKSHVAPRTAFPFEYISIPQIPDFLESARNEPFCLIIAYNAPHEPYFNKKNGVPYNKIKAKEWLPDTDETLRLTAAYYDNIQNLDNEIGTSLYWIEKMGITENTIQIYISDHGSGLPYGKWSLYEKGLHVPMIIKWKEIIKPGTRSDQLISLVDLLPTLLEITGAHIPDDLDGKSFLHIVTGKTKTIHEYIYAAHTNLGVNYGNHYPIRSIRNERYKLIVNFNHHEPFSIRITEVPDERSVICGYRVLNSWRNNENNDAFAAERYHNFRYRPPIELYDLNHDPFELENLAGNPDYKEVKLILVEELKKWMHNQNDFLANKFDSQYFDRN